MNFFEKCGNSLIFRENGETVMISPWGKNSFRVRATFLGDIDEHINAALLEQEACETEIELG